MTRQEVQQKIKNVQIARDNQIRNILKTHCSRNTEGIILRRLIGNQDISVEELVYLFTEMMPEITLEINEVYKK